MSEQNKSVVRKYYELLDRGDMPGMMALFADNLAWRFTGQPTPLTKATIAGLIQGFRTAFPNMKHLLDAQVAEGDWVATPLTFRGTHTGNLMGIPPSGKPVEARGINLHRVSGGKIVEAETVVDLMALMQQIGAVPTPG
jgi:steroid delta-isomerase-like uncharacterized protein